MSTTPVDKPSSYTPQEHSEASPENAPAPPTPHTPRPAAYRSYLLRLWRDQALDGWHASLQSTQTGQRHSFADLDSLLAFLLTQTLIDGA